MKQKLLKLFLFFLPFTNYGQSFVGFLTDNYSGVHGVIANPANVVDSRLKFDLNLSSVSAFLGNDYAEISLFDSFDDDYEFDTDRILTLSDDNNGLVNVDVLGPSFMFNINRNNSIALSTRARVFGSINNINGEVIDLFDNKIDENVPVNIANLNVNATAHAWAEYGLTYGRVLLDKGAHFLKGGITFKYLQGYGYASAIINNASIDYDPFVLNPPSTINGEFIGNGTGDYTFSNNFDTNNNGEAFENDDDVEYKAQASGVGFDVGFVYEWRPEADKYKTKDINGNLVPLKYKNKYYLKVGLSITDIGSLKYKEGFNTNYNLNGVAIDRRTIEDGDFEEEIEPLLNPREEIISSKIKLPAGIHVNIDWNAYKKLYLNLNTDLSLINEDKENANRIANTLSLTPRLETKWASLYSPVSIREYGGFIWGAGIRLGPIFVGSGSILTNLMGKSKTADVYAGLKLPIYQSKLKDKDKDGVYDKYDECPKEAGPVENNGCPLPVVVEVVEEVVELDTDNDGIVDSLDECPNEFGLAENNGCPKIEPIVIDTDNDGIEDSKDACPDKFGLVANNGCPNITNLNDDVEKAKEVVETINEYAKTINFASGKTTFTSETFDSLTSILAILNKYPDSNFEINGYTDSVGSSALNLKLSQNRAYAVLAYFVENGIGTQRLKAVGHGEENPIADNATKQGRALNRRVEIVLIK